MRMHLGGIVAVGFCCALGLAVGVLADCTSVDLDSDVFGTGLGNDLPINLLSNFATVIKGSDDAGPYVGMRWSSYDPTDFGMLMKNQPAEGADSLVLVLSASAPMDVRVWVTTHGDYCGRGFREASVPEPLHVVTSAERFEIPWTAFTDDPTGYCPGSIAENGLTDLYQLILLPSDKDGELKVYEVSQCGPAAATAAISEPGQGQDGTTGFTVDSDVTLDSVVQIGDGPQQLSTDIKFYPNTRRAKPGDTVYWTLEIGEGSGLVPPFTIIAELNNDLESEEGATMGQGSATLPYTYAEPNPHRAIVRIRDSRGKAAVAYSYEMLGVIPEQEERAGVGVQIATPENPTGDVIKAGGINIVDEHLFATDQGLRDIEEAVTSWVDVGFNTVFISFLWLVSDGRANAPYPIYSEAVPAFGKATNRLSHMIRLTEMIHDKGMRVGWRLVLQDIHDVSALSRLYFRPTDLNLYFALHTQATLYYAEIAESLGVEFLGIDTENPAFSCDTRALDTYWAVRDVYSGIIFDEVIVGRCAPSVSPLTDLLDVVFFSAGPEFDNTHTVEQMRGIFGLQYRYEMLDELSHVQKPGIFEIFADGQQDETFQARAYETFLEAFSATDSSMQGIVFWELTVNPEWRWENPQYNMMGRQAEHVLREYFCDILPDMITLSFEPLNEQSAVRRVLASFDEADSDSIRVERTAGGECNFSLKSAPDQRSSCLQVEFTHTGKEAEVAWYSLAKELPHPTSLSDSTTLYFWLKNDGSSLNVTVALWDRDGDKYYARVNTTPRPGEWRLFSIPLNAFVPTYRAAGADGALDLSGISRIEIGEAFTDPGHHVSLLDDIFVGTEPPRVSRRVD